MINFIKNTSFSRISFASYMFYRNKFIEMINNFTVTFEDGSYIVNLTGANNNIIESSNLNGVSIRGNNSAGLIKAGGLATTEDVADTVWEALKAGPSGGGDWTTASFGELMNQMITLGKFLGLK